MTILERLYALQDKEYAAFQAKLTPGVDPDLFIGVRIPEARKLAKSLMKEQKVPESSGVPESSKAPESSGAPESSKAPESSGVPESSKVPESSEILAFLQTLPHTYYDENILHVILLSEMKDYEECLAGVEAFLPYIDNWAVCDILSPKTFKKHKPELIEKIRVWSASPETYTCRFGLEMLMTHYLDADFREEYLEIPAEIRSEEYYVKMMQAWFFATALAKQWDASIRILLDERLDPWVHNKTIQKARESYRITPEQKEYLKSLKRKGNA